MTSPITKAPETFYRVEVSDRDGQIVTIEPEMLAGRAIGEPEEKALRAASDSLTGFIGRRSYDSLARELEQAKERIQQLERTKVALPRITAEILQEWQGHPELIEVTEDGPQWTPNAVDFASLLQCERAALKPSNEVGT